MPHHGPTGHWSVPLASPPEIAEAKSLVVDLIHQIHRLLLRGCKQRAQAASSYSIHHGTPLAQPPPLFFLLLPPLRADLGFWMAIVVGQRCLGLFFVVRPLFCPPRWRRMDGWVAKKRTRRNLALKPAVAVAGTATL